MALFDRASLVQIPSGYKEGKLYNIKPFDQPFEFERGSAATRVNEDGLIETFYDEATNLLLQSNQFDTTWTTFNADTPTTGYSGYDGSTDAWLLSKTGSGGSVTQTVSTSGVQTISFYAKANTSNWIRVTLGSVGTSFFDLANGVFGVDQSISSNATSLGDGWHRISLTFNGSGTHVQLFVADGDNDISGTSGSIYIQDAQLESGYFATPYIETTTEAVTRPNRHDTPRIDYTNGKSLLLEPQRTNYTPYSEDFTQWTRGGGQQYVTSNYAISPDGTQNADRILFTGENQEVAFNDASISGATVGSIYIKGTSGETIRFGVNDSNVPTHTLDGTWQRIEAIRSTTGGVRLTVNTYGGATARDVLVWGAQLEQASYATSYIPTNGQTETRLLEYCHLENSTNLIGQNEGSYYIEWTHRIADQTYSIFNITDGTNDNRIQLSFNQSLNLGFLYAVDGSTHFSDVNIQQLSVGQNYKFAVTYTQNSLTAYLDGIKIIDYTSFSASNGNFNQIAFGLKSDNPSFKFNMPCSKVVVFPEALTDTELQELTTI